MGRRKSASSSDEHLAPTDPAMQTVQDLFHAWLRQLVARTGVDDTAEMLGTSRTNVYNLLNKYENRKVSAEHLSAYMRSRGLSLVDIISELMTIAHKLESNTFEAELEKPKSDRRRRWAADKLTATERPGTYLEKDVAEARKRRLSEKTAIRAELEEMRRELREIKSAIRRPSDERSTQRRDPSNDDKPRRGK